GSVAGTDYPYIVKDSKGCTETYTATVKQPAGITASASISTAYTCDNPATIAASASGGNGTTYNYALMRAGVPTAVASNTTGIFTNLTVAGNYTVVVTDGKGCAITTTPALTIVALNPPAAMTISNSALTCPTNKATVTITNVTNSAGDAITSGLEYRMVLPTAGTFSSSNSFANLDPGITYTFEVKDANNCKYSKTHTITSLPVFTVGLKSSVDVTCFGDTNGTAIFTVSNLAVGTAYTYKVDSGSLVSGTVTVAPFDITVSNLAAGSHDITVTNTVTNCDVTANVSIGAPTAALALDPTTITNVTCNANGTAVINAKDGWGTYTYAVTGTTPPIATITQTNKTFSNLNAGDYSVTVTDLKGCQVSGTFTILDKVLPTASIDASSVYCAGGGGATLAVTPNAQTNYTYTINNGTAQATGTFAGLTPGKYTIRVTDTSTGCSIPLPEQTINSALTASTTLLKDLDCDATNPDASIQVTISNGYPDYTYRVNTTGVSFTGSPIVVGTGVSVFTYTEATSGTYYFEITDSKGCTTVVSRTINAKVDPTATTTPTNPKCFNGTDGSITVNASLGTAPYTYEVSTTSGTVGFTTMVSNIHANIGAGNYWFRVTDAKKCQIVVAQTLANPTKLEATAAVTTPLKCGVGNAVQAAVITVTIDPTLIGTPYSGANAYRYSYNGTTPVTSNTFTTSTTGPVPIVVYDANGCSFTTSATVVALDPPTTMTFAQANVISCDTSQLDTDLTVSFSNGVGPFKVEITSTDAAIAPTAPVATGVSGNSHTFADLSPGTYFFKVTDANNCTLTGDFKINPVTPIQTVGAIVTNVTCNGVADGVLKFTVSGNKATAYTPLLVGSVSGTIAGGVNVSDVITYSNLNGGETYTFTVTNDDTKCTATSVITLSQPTAITALTANATKVFCTKATTTITVSATGGNSPLYYAVMKSGDTPVFPTNYNTTGIFNKNTTVDGLAYVAYVVDKNGKCPQNVTVNVVQDAAPTVDTPAAQCYTGTPLSITMTGTVFASSSIQYGINGVYSTNATKTIPGAGTYNLTVKDDNGCISPV
ncbi:beta strand repeat-containing protein, partial [Flavobacterium sp.]|uniref:beta strand repeat-containing protein n=1 Tax=Flavobacterium sp. TaxID=239 RepID=UPI003C473DAA